MQDFWRITDKGLFLYLNRTISNPLFDSVMPFVTDNPALLLLPAVLFILLRDRKNLLLTILLSIAALTISDAISNLLKEGFHRPRPFLTLTEVITLVGRGGSYSMPSAHAANISSVVTLLLYMLYMLQQTACRRLTAAYLAAVAIFVSFSRIYVGVHYPSDVIAGVILGVFSGLIVILSFNRLKAYKERGDYSALLVAALIIIALFRIYYIITGPLDLSPDEAQYWDWSRRLDLSYYSKGPAIAYFIAVSKSVLGSTLPGVRSPAILFSLLSSIILYRMTSEMLRSQAVMDSRLYSIAGFISAMLIQVIPLFTTYGVIMTIDSPLIFFWTLSIYIFYHAQRPNEDEGASRLSLWVLLGISVGIGLLTKYTMAFFYLSAFIYLAADRERRQLLIRPAPWVGAAVSFMVFSPVILWNARHGWVTFLHTAGQAHIRDGLQVDLSRFFEFIGSQLGVVTPVLFSLIVISLFLMRKRSPEGKLLFWFSIPLLLFFMLKSLQGKVQANWALPAYISGIAALSIYTVTSWHSFKRSVKAVFIAGLILSVSLTILSHYPAVLNLPAKMDPTTRLRGWEELGEEVGKIAEEFNAPHFIFSDRYQVTSELAFYTPGNPTTYNINLGRRMNQYDIWPGFHNLKGYNALYVTYGDGPLPDKIIDAFRDYEQRSFVATEKGRVVRRYSIFLCYGFKGMERFLPERF